MSAPEDSPEGGEQFLAHPTRKRTLEPAFGDPEEIELITSHIGQHIGDPGNVFHEFFSNWVHLDVHLVKPAPGRNYHTLVTSGMSGRAMKALVDEAEFKYAELMMCLPPDWQFETMEDQWPVDLLRFLARFPHEFDTWIAENHSLPNGDPPELLPGTKMRAMLIATPRTAPEEFWKLKINDEKTIYFWAVVPLYMEELDLKLKQGTEVLLARLAEHNVTELLNPKRRNTARKFLGLF